MIVWLRLETYLGNFDRSDFPSQLYKLLTAASSTQSGAFWLNFWTFSWLNAFSDTILSQNFDEDLVESDHQALASLNLNGKSVVPMNYWNSSP